MKIMVTYTVEYKRSFFSNKEIQDILISVIVLSMALFFVIERYAFPSSINLFDKLAIAFLMVITAFFLHEMSHKFTAIRMGAWSEFRMWPLGVLLTLITGLLGFLFALPGAVYFASYRNPIREGKIALAGPVTNIVIALILLPVFLMLYVSLFVHIALFFMIYINIWLAFFNLLPIPPLDGSKVFAWSKRNWGLVIGIAVILLIYDFMFLSI